MGSWKKAPRPCLPATTPKNTASRALLLRLGFVYDHDAFYPPTGLYHPSYFYRPCTAPTEAPPHATGGLL